MNWDQNGRTFRKQRSLIKSVLEKYPQNDMVIEYASKLATNLCFKTKQISPCDSSKNNKKILSLTHIKQQVVVFSQGLENLSKSNSAVVLKATICSLRIKYLSCV